MTAERKDLVAALGHSLKAIDDDYKEEMRELRALFEEAKKEAEKDEPDGVKLKALLADANEMVRPSPSSIRRGRPSSASPGCSECCSQTSRDELSDAGNFVGGASFLGAACVPPASSRC